MQSAGTEACRIQRLRRVHGPRANSAWPPFEIDEANATIPHNTAHP